MSHRRSWRGASGLLKRGDRHHLPRGTPFAEWNSESRHGEGAEMKALLLAAIIALAGCATTTRIGAGECVVFKDSWFSSERTVIGHGCDTKKVYQ